MHQAGLYIGPREVHALPLGVAAEHSVHYFGDYFSYTSLQEGAVSRKFCFVCPPPAVMLPLSMVNKDLFNSFIFFFPHVPLMKELFGVRTLL